LVLPTSYVLINSDLGTDVETIEKIKEMILAQDEVKLEIQGVYGVYDIILKLSSDDSEKLRSIITNDIRKIENVQSTLTMLVIEQQEKS
jgi:DNA-binding Lrp family transcriptional regulator